MSFVGRRGSSQGRGKPIRDELGQQPPSCQGQGGWAGVAPWPRVAQSCLCPGPVQTSLPSFSPHPGASNCTCPSWSLPLHPPSPLAHTHTQSPPCHCPAASVPDRLEPLGPSSWGRSQFGVAVTIGWQGCFSVTLSNIGLLLPHTRSYGRCWGHAGTTEALAVPLRCSP